MEKDEAEQLSFAITQIMNKVKNVELESNEDFVAFQVDLYNHLSYLRKRIVTNTLKK